MLVITLIAFALVGFVVFIHYEILLNITKFISKALDHQGSKSILLLLELL